LICPADRNGPESVRPEAQRLEGGVDGGRTLGAALLGRNTAKGLDLSTGAFLLKKRRTD